MTFHTKAGNIYMLIINRSPVSHTTFTKSLVVYIDHNLCWNVYVDNLSKKIASGIGMLTLSRAFFPSDTLQNMISHTSITVTRFVVAVTKHFLLNFRYSEIKRHGLRASYDINSESLIDKLGWRKLDTQRKSTKGYSGISIDQWVSF